jgi:hypothetical protein
MLSNNEKVDEKQIVELYSAINLINNVFERCQKIECHY